MCTVCNGKKAIVSSNRGAQWADIWCPVCNLEMYLAESSIISDARAQIKSDGIAIALLKEELEGYIGHGWITKEKADELLNQAYDLKKRIEENPSLGEELMKRKSNFYTQFRNSQEH